MLFIRHFGIQGEGQAFISFSREKALSPAHNVASCILSLCRQKSFPWLACRAVLYCPII